FRLASHEASQEACALTSAVQLKATCALTLTPAATALSTRAFRTPHASAAVVLLASSPRSVFIALHTARNRASTSLARTSRFAAACANALMVACAPTVTSRPSHPFDAFSRSLAAEQPLIPSAVANTSARLPGTYFKAFIRIM